MKWLDRWRERQSAPPEPFDCAWCLRGGGHERHDMCTGSAVHPHGGDVPRAAGTAQCACALRGHTWAGRASAPEETRFPTLPDDWAERRKLPAKKPPSNGPARG